jgi:hypothetical protein
MQPGRVTDPGDGNYYANAGSFVPAPTPTCTKQAEDFEEAIENLKRAMKTLQLEPCVYPMQIAPPPTNADDSGIGLGDAFEVKTDAVKLAEVVGKANEQIEEDRWSWARKCDAMNWPQWMDMRSIVYERDGTECVEKDEVWTPRVDKAE